MELRFPKLEFIANGRDEPANDELAAREHRRVLSEALALPAAGHLGSLATAELAVGLPMQRTIAVQEAENS
jgi:hypothetical protein